MFVKLLFTSINLLMTIEYYFPNNVREISKNPIIVSLFIRVCDL